MKRFLSAAPFISLILYLVAIYPFPERFPFLSSPFIAIILLLLVVGYGSLEYRGEQNKNLKIALAVRNIVFILMGINLFFFPELFFFSDTFHFFNTGIGSPIIAILLLTLPDWKIFNTSKDDHVSEN